MATTLNTANPEYLLWEYQQVGITILGGIRIEGLDRMRVTLKLSWKEQVIRHNLDLYNDAAVDKLVKRCAERFALGTGFMAELVTALTNTLEQYRLEELKKKGNQNKYAALWLHIGEVRLLLS
jgi:hypothetical protein